MLTKIRKFRSGSKLRINLLNILVKLVDHKITNELRSQFELLDKDHSGVVTTDELKKQLQTIDANITDEEVEEIMAQLDVEKNGSISWNEFLAATLPLETLS